MTLTQQRNVSSYGIARRITDEAVKLKDKLVIRLRPMLSLIKGMGRAIDSQLGKRTKPILDVLHYWQGMLCPISITRNDD